MIIESFYLSSSKGLKRACQVTDLSKEEIIEIVGKFGKNSHRYGQVKGEVVVYSDGSVVIRHHFTKKILWELVSSFQDFDERF